MGVGHTTAREVKTSHWSCIKSIITIVLIKILIQKNLFLQYELGDKGPVDNEDLHKSFNSNTFSV